MVTQLTERKNNVVKIQRIKNQKFPKLLNKKNTEIMREKEKIETTKLWKKQKRQIIAPKFKDGNFFFEEYFFFNPQSVKIKSHKIPQKNRNTKKMVAKFTQKMW